MYKECTTTIRLGDCIYGEVLYPVWDKEVVLICDSNFIPNKSMSFVEQKINSINCRTIYHHPDSNIFIAGRLYPECEYKGFHHQTRGEGDKKYTVIVDAQCLQPGDIVEAMLPGGTRLAVVREYLSESNTLHVLDRWYTNNTYRIELPLPGVNPIPKILVTPPPVTSSPNPGVDVLKKYKEIPAPGAIVEALVSKHKVCSVIVGTDEINLILDNGRIWSVYLVKYISGPKMTYVIE